MRAVDLFQTLLKIGSGLLYMGQESGIADPAHHYIGHCRDKRAAGKGRTMIAGMDDIGHALGDQHRADGQAIGQGFGRTEDVRHDAVRFVRPECAGAPHPTLHLIEDEQGIMFVGEFAQRHHEFVAGRMDAAFALHRLYDHSADAVIDDLGGAGEIIELAQTHAWHQGAERHPDIWGGGWRPARRWCDHGRRR